MPDFLQKDDAMKAFSFVSRAPEGTEGCLIFDLQGYIDAHTVIEFEKAVKQSVESGFHNVVLDLNGLNYISSAGIGAMLKLSQTLNQFKGSLVLLNPTQKVFAILQGLGFVRIFRIAWNEEEALQHLRPEANAATPPAAKDEATDGKC